MMKLLLDVLADGAFHSGEELGALLGVSRSAVWKQLRRLSDRYNLEVQAVRGRGYRLPSPLNLLIDEGALTARLGLPCFRFDQIDSTNLEAQRKFSAADTGLPFCVTAESQTAGRGRRGREWVSPFAENIYLSLVLPIGGGARALEGLSLTVGVALFRVLTRFGLVGVGLKWPNDVLLGRRKLAGILLELHGDPSNGGGVVVGVGINVNMQSAEVDQAWTSLRVASGHLVDRNELLEQVCLETLACCQQHMREGFEVFRLEWQLAHLWQGCEVFLGSAQHKVSGVVEGVDRSGALILRRGNDLSVHSGGELSLRLAHDS